MNIVLWVLQVILGLYFLQTGTMHFLVLANVAPTLPPLFGWMYDLSATLHIISGVAELLGGLGLILPGLTKIQTRLTPLAALGLVLTMVGAMVYHISQGEAGLIVQNVVLALLLAFVAVGRFSLSPLKDRNTAET
jgi:uncharacterized membrane protein YphA (DoxX/SURF4 family)